MNGRRRKRKVLEAHAAMSWLENSTKERWHCALDCCSHMHYTFLFVILYSLLSMHKIEWNKHKIENEQNQVCEKGQKKRKETKKMNWKKATCCGEKWLNSLVCCVQLLISYKKQWNRIIHCRLPISRYLSHIFFIFFSTLFFSVAFRSANPRYKAKNTKNNSSSFDFFSKFHVFLNINSILLNPNTFIILSDDE